jgi:hypothetical protein
VLLVLLTLPVSAWADGGEDEFTQTVNGYEVTLVFDESATVGENQIHIQVGDSQHMPVSNADIEVSVVESEGDHVEAESAADNEVSDMAGMGGDPEQQAEAPASEHAEADTVTFEAGHEKGEYAGEIAIDEPGDWAIRVHLTIQGETMEVEFPLTIAHPKSGSGILTGFLALNAVILVAALVLKSKPPKPVTA